MTDIYVKTFEDNLTLNPLTIRPLTIADVQKVVPIGVHIKELNQIAPLLVESLRVDHVRHIDPLRIERLNITQLPSVNLSMSRLPPLDLNVRHVPPVAIALQQQLELASNYTMRARLLGLDIMRMEIQGKTRLVPLDCARREQSRSHERSFPAVAAAGNPAIPTRATETCTQTVTRSAPPPRKVRRHALNAGAPRFNYSLGGAGGIAAAVPPPADSSVSFGG